MKKQSIKKHLQSYSIYGKRKSTLAHAFASALSVADTYEETKIDNAIKLLGQDPSQDLVCVYCGRSAKTWDHIMAIVKEGRFSGYGHQVGNLVPCCNECNSDKGNKDWKTFLITKNPNEATNLIMINRIHEYIKSNTTQFKELLDDDIKNEIEKFENIKQQIFELLKAGDQQAKIIRGKLKYKSKNKTFTQDGLEQGDSIFQIEPIFKEKRQTKPELIPFVSKKTKVNNNETNKESQEIEKVEKRVPKWFKNPDQFNSQILISFMELQGKKGFVNLIDLEKACSGIKTFKPNFDAMKNITPHNSGKVFHENEKNEITLWGLVEEFVMMEYNKYLRKG